MQKKTCVNWRRARVRNGVCNPDVRPWVDAGSPIWRGCSTHCVVSLPPPRCSRHIRGCRIQAIMKSGMALPWLVLQPGMQRWLALQACFPEMWEPCYHTGTTDIETATATITAILFSLKCSDMPTLTGISGSNQQLGTHSFLSRPYPTSQQPPSLRFCLFPLLKATHSLSYCVIS